MTVPTHPTSRFVFCVCQFGMENICKREILALHPFLAFAFSRPGFLTFKVQAGVDLPETFELKTTFARTSGWSLGRIDKAELGSVATELIPRIEQTKATCVHVWQRDSAMPGDNGFEPGISPRAQSVATELFNLVALQAGQGRTTTGIDIAFPTGDSRRPMIRVNQIAEHAERVFDVVLVEPDSWWLGWHTAHSVPRRWPGGVPIADLSKPVISRAYWKMAEALAWSRFQTDPGQWCVELGAAPGGACQYLLERGLHVIAVDPAELDERLKHEPNLVHLGCRSREVRRARLKQARWLFADLNVAPTYTLDTVGDLISSPKIMLHGMLLTLKLMSLELAQNIPEFVARVSSWGYSGIHVRQLAFNRREVCLMAVMEESD